MPVMAQSSALLMNGEFEITLLSESQSSFVQETRNNLVNSHMKFVAKTLVRI